MTTTSTKSIVYIALFAALTGAMGIFPPIPVLAVPITLQSMAPMLAGGILGAKRGALSLLLFVILLAIGLPLLPGGRGGLGVFFGPTTGFILSWIVTAWCIGWMTTKWGNNKLFYTIIINIIFGSFLCYAIGIPWMLHYLKLTLWQACAALLVFIPGDIIKAIIAALVVTRVRKIYPLHLS